MKLGILGTGKIVQEFLPWLVEHTPFTVQAVCSTPRSAAKAAELCAQYQIPQHTTNYFELLQWVDAVYIAVPNLQHARYARVALDVDAKDELKRALQEYRGSILLICHEPEFYQDIVNEVWDCSKWTTKIL